MKLANSYVKLPAPPYRLGPRASRRSGTESRYGQRMYEILSVLRSFFLLVGYRRILNTHWLNLVKDFSIKVGTFSVTEIYWDTFPKIFKQSSEKG